MRRAKASHLVAIWFAMALGVEVFGACGYAVHAVHAGYFGGLAITKGPIRVLVVYDAAEQPINSTQVIHYLRTHCTKVGDTAEWRQWNEATDATNESAEWRKLFSLPRDKLPWVVIENSAGQRFSGPLPASDSDRLALFEKWGGP